MARHAASGGGQSGAGFVPHIDMARGHARMLEICDALEQLADDLPSHVDRLRCLMLGNSLVPLIDACHRFEERSVFPAFATSRRNTGIVNRLRAEHVQDRCAAEDLSEALLAYGNGRPIANPEAFGYMLRALFDSMRRHIAFEQDCILSAPPGPDGR